MTQYNIVIDDVLNNFSCGGECGIIRKTPLHSWVFDEGGFISQSVLVHPTAEEKQKYAGLVPEPPAPARYLRGTNVWVMEQTWMDYYMKHALQAVWSVPSWRYGNWATIGSKEEATQPTPPLSPLWENPTQIAEEIIAYRGWEYDTKLLEDGTVDCALMSLHNETVWDGPVATADAAPSADGMHGLYSVSLEDRHEENFNNYVRTADIWGRVALSGLVVEGANGFRSERATIQELWINPESFDDDYERSDSPKGLLKLLGDRYQCDVSLRVPVWSELQGVQV